MAKGIKALLERLPEKVLVSVNGYKKYLKRNFVLEYAQEAKWKARAGNTFPTMRIHGILTKCARHGRQRVRSANTTKSKAENRIHCASLIDAWRHTVTEYYITTHKQKTITTLNLTISVIKGGINMDTYLQYDHTITTAQMENAMRHGYTVLVIINGEYYEYKPEEKKGETI